MTEEYYVGQIFEGEYPPECAEWCNNRGDVYIAEIEPLDNVRRFEIKEIPAPTPEEERARINALQVTKRVFMLGLQQLGITYTQLKELLATNENAQMEWDLCVELLRGNPLLDIMASQFGVSSAMLDYIFQKANGEDVDPPVGV